MAALGKLKTCDYFAKLELGPNFSCCFCNNSLEPHNHLLFGCSFSRDLFIELVLRGNFFLLEPTISEALLFDSSFSDKSEARVYLLIISSLVYWI